MTTLAPRTSITESLWQRPLLALYGVSLLSGFALGIFNPLISILLEQHGLHHVVIGANASGYYLVVALCAPLAARLIKSLGIRPVMVAGILLTALAALCFPYTTSLTLWFLLRLLMGIGICLYLVAGQTGLNLYADSKHRGVIVATHGALFGVGFIISPLIGTWVHAAWPQYSFAVGSGIIAAGLLLVPWLNERNRTPQLLAGRQVLRKITIPLQAAFIYGALEGILVSLLPVYLLQQAVPLAYAAWPLPLFMIASGVGMLPVGRLSDRYGQRSILQGSAWIGVITLCLMVSFDWQHSIAVGAVLLGFSVGTFFPVALAMIGNLLNKNELATGSSLFTASFSYGCAAGPLIATLLMSVLGSQHVFSFISLLLIILIVTMMLKSSSHPALTVNKDIS